MAIQLSTLRARTLEVARKLGTDAREYDKRGGYRDSAGPGPVQRMVSDGTVSSTNRDSLTDMIGKASREVAYTSGLAKNVAAVKRELTVFRHVHPQGENAPQAYSSGPLRENSPQQYTSGPLRENAPQRYNEMIEVPPTDAAVAKRMAIYAQQAARAQLALGTLVEVKDAVVEQLAQQSLLVNVWEALKDSGKAD